MVLDNTLNDIIEESSVEFSQWDTPSGEGGSTLGTKVVSKYMRAKSEMNTRTLDIFPVYEKLMNNEVVDEDEYLANISSGEVCAIIKKTANKVVQQVPKAELMTFFSQDTPQFSALNFIYNNNVVSNYTNPSELQQDLISTFKDAATFGFSTVIPILKYDAFKKDYYIEYDSIPWNDVFPEFSAKDIRKANYVYIRRWYSPDDLRQIIKSGDETWNLEALRTILKDKTMLNKDFYSNSKQDKKYGKTNYGYPLITLYRNGGEDHLTFLDETLAGQSQLLRIEENRHPSGNHPVHFLVLEKDKVSPYGISLIDGITGRARFQDILLNSVAQTYLLNAKPVYKGRSINGQMDIYPGTFLDLGTNPSADISTLDISTQVIQQYPQIQQAGYAAMINNTSAAEQSLSAQSGGNMSQTPNGVEAQQAMVDVATNVYQKSMEAFFGNYSTYALNLFLSECQDITDIQVNADTFKYLDIPKESIMAAKGRLKVNMKELGEMYIYVKCVPGSVSELENEKQLALIQQSLLLLTQNAQAVSQLSQDPQLGKSISEAILFCLSKTFELGGLAFGQDIDKILGISKEDNAQKQDQNGMSIQSIAQMVAQLAKKVNAMDTQNKMDTVSQQNPNLTEQENSDTINNKQEEEPANNKKFWH